LNLWIVLFLGVGAVFGLATYSNRHLFSEGPTQRTSDSGSALNGRLLWVLISTCLWPILALTGLYSLWRKRGAGRREAERSDR